MKTLILAIALAGPVSVHVSPPAPHVSVVEPVITPHVSEPVIIEHEAITPTSSRAMDDDGMTTTGRYYTPPPVALSHRPADDPQAADVMNDDTADTTMTPAAAEATVVMSQMRHDNAMTAEQAHDLAAANAADDTAQPGKDRHAEWLAVLAACGFVGVVCFFLGRRR